MSTATHIEPTVVLPKAYSPTADDMKHFYRAVFGARLVAVVHRSRPSAPRSRSARVVRRRTRRSSRSPGRQSEPDPSAIPSGVVL